jgi:transcription-repair coupling factor (superfamily II helicase)
LPVGQKAIYDLKRLKCDIITLLINLSRQLLIAGLTPFFLEKGLLWFEQNSKELSAREDCLTLKEGQEIPLTELLQKLARLGYERTHQTEFPGEFSQQGGLVDVFPLNSRPARRIEFLGDKIETISSLPIENIDEDKVRKVLRAKLRSQKLFSGLNNLRPGDYIVHLDHGVGRFAGTVSLSLQDYYVLEYAQNDKLYVPFGLERKLSRYIGFTQPSIYRLGGVSWQRTKGKVKEEVEKFARELLQVYAQRETAVRPPYTLDSEIESALERNFPFQETEGQLKALDEIRKDLLKTKPMDRLLCGDVGFGKTEVALRAMLWTVLSGYQAALLCPTTILVNQHFQNFKERLKGLPIALSFLSRLQTKKEQKEILEKLASGKIDIVVATHRLLSKDMEASFSKLGLLVIDDEQRFGVRQKEKLKKLRSSLDVLSLSATPIPRTLYLALSSLREMSFIQTPPEGRLPVKTFVLPWSKETIKQALSKEIGRGGQVYYLHNRVATIGQTKEFLARLWPGLRISVVHGRLKEKELIGAMAEFRTGKANLLLATTIIENGLDLANANTLLVEDASQLGLSQAYQLRGRVGRDRQQASAYFLHPYRLSPLAKQRLEALKQAEALGSGWQVALKDLEIRGAGNILGKEQSGNVNQVGLNLYCQMLAEAVAKARS